MSYRAKGFFWLASWPEWGGEISMAGAVRQYCATGPWWAAVPEERWPEERASRRMIAGRWDEAWGDRRQELVFIGVGLDRDRLDRALSACLLTEAELEAGEAALSHRPEPLVAVTTEMTAWFDDEPGITAGAPLEPRRQRHPGTYPDHLIRAVRPRVKAWREDPARALVLDLVPAAAPTAENVSPVTTSETSQVSVELGTRGTTDDAN